jgi:hypothetical protein
MSVNYELKTTELTIDELKKFLIPEKTLHLKGFASGMDVNLVLPRPVLEFVLQYDNFVFDGDDLDPHSFTKFIACIIPSLVTCSNKRIIAFKYRSSLNDFFTSWGYEATKLKIRLNYNNGLPYRFAVLPEGDIGIVPDVPIFVVPVEEPVAMLNDPNNIDYLYLAQEALNTTHAMAVLSFGGGEGIRQEYDATSADIHWYVYNLNRWNCKTNTIEEPALLKKEMKLKNGHERIIGDVFTTICPKAFL